MKTGLLKLEGFGNESSLYLRKTVPVAFSLSTPFRVVPYNSAVARLQHRGAEHLKKVEP